MSRLKQIKQDLFILCIPASYTQEQQKNDIQFEILKMGTNSCQKKKLPKKADYSLQGFTTNYFIKMQQKCLILTIRVYSSSTTLIKPINLFLSQKKNPSEDHASNLTTTYQGFYYILHGKALQGGKKQKALFMIIEIKTKLCTLSGCD